MSDRRTLFTIDYHADDDTGMYRVGEVDFGLRTATIEEFVDHYGHEGVKDVSDLIRVVLGEFTRHLENKAAREQQAGGATEARP